MEAVKFQFFVFFFLVTIERILSLQTGGGPSFAESGWMECEAKSSFSTGNVFCDLALWLRFLPVNRLS